MRMALSLGACLCETFEATGGGIEHLRVVYAEPNKRAILTGSLGPLLYEATSGVMDLTVERIAARVARDDELSRERLLQGRRRQARAGRRPSPCRPAEALPRLRDRAAAHALGALEGHEAERRVSPPDAPRSTPRAIRPFGDRRGPYRRRRPRALRSARCAAPAAGTAGRSPPRRSPKPCPRQAAAHLRHRPPPRRPRRSSPRRASARYAAGRAAARGRLSNVFRPMIIALPMVSALNRLRSAEMCHGMVPPRPITPFCARATTRVMDGPAMRPLWRACAVLPSALLRRHERCPLTNARSGRAPARCKGRDHRAIRDRAVADRLARPRAWRGARDPRARNRPRRSPGSSLWRPSTACRWCRRAAIPEWSRGRPRRRTGRR